MTQITLKIAEQSWTEILQKAMDGEEFIIESNGKPVAKLSPIKNDDDWFGMDEGKGWIAEDFNSTPQDIIEVFKGQN